MKKTFYFTFLITFLVAVSAHSNEFQINVQFNAATGDSNFDSVLKNINISAGSKISLFINDLSSTFKIPQKDINFLIYNEKIQPADVLMILQLVQISGKPLDIVIKKYKKHRAKGWGAIALSFGIKPGTDKFLLLIENIPATIWKYKEVDIKGSKGSKHKKHKKGSKGKKHSKGSKKGSKGKKKNK